MDIETKHHQLDVLIQTEEKRRPLDTVKIAKLKKEKLLLKDKIAHHI